MWHGFADRALAGEVLTRDEARSVLAAPDDDRVAATVKQEVDRICKAFPLYSN